jgi:DNA-binding transcriptional LysR family regulator
VVVLPAGHPLAGSAQVALEELRREPFVAMRAGYLMHRFVHRLFGARLPPVTHTTDGAELGKLLVAQGLGVTVLPDYSVLGDPLERAGLVVQRPIAGDRTTITLVLRQRRAERVPAAVGGLRDALVARGRAYRDRAEP